GRALQMLVARAEWRTRRVVDTAPHLHRRVCVIRRAVAKLTVAVVSPGEHPSARSERARGLAAARDCADASAGVSEGWNGRLLCAVRSVAERSVRVAPPGASRAIGHTNDRVRVPGGDLTDGHAGVKSRDESRRRARRGRAIAKLAVAVAAP